MENSKLKKTRNVLLNDSSNHAFNRALFILFDTLVDIVDNDHRDRPGFVEDCGHFTMEVEPNRIHLYLNKTGEPLATITIN